MKYYIDFDNTLYETAKLTTCMLDAICKTVVEKLGKEYSEIDEYVKANFNSTTDNIFTFARETGSYYGIDPDLVENNVKAVVDNGNNIVFEDAERFLARLKENGHEVHILTYIPKTNQEYQMKKLLGSGLMKYFDTITITSKYKFLLDMDYTQGIYIDDDPRDLNGLYEKNPIKVIRIRKPNNKRSKIDIDNKNIEEYVSFDDIEV
ncbi:MAG: HAD family hydrolase [Clostridia bacterium]|nr:HAD family hydrolase [Clostridia bacterium]